MVKARPSPANIVTEIVTTSRPPVTPATFDAEIVEPEPLTPAESDRLAELEGIIEKGMQEHPEMFKDEPDALIVEEPEQPVTPNESSAAYDEIIRLLAKLSNAQLLDLRRVITARWS